MCELHTHNEFAFHAFPAYQDTGVALRRTPFYEIAAAIAGQARSSDDEKYSKDRFRHRPKTPLKKHKKGDSRLRIRF